MAANGNDHSLKPGDPAPAFVLPAVNREGDVSLNDYRGKKPVLLALHRGLHCPFCRRRLASLDVVRSKLEEAGVDVLAVVNSQLERARLYLRYRSVPVLLAADPERSAHRAFGVPLVEITERETDWPRKLAMTELVELRSDAGGELPEPLSAPEMIAALNTKDGYEMTEADDRVNAAYPLSLEGHFLIDREGVIRWLWIEAPHGIGEIAQLPSAEELLSAATSALPS